MRWPFLALQLATLFCAFYSYAAADNNGSSAQTGNASAVLDLNGVWESVSRPPAATGAHSQVRVLVYQLKNTIQIYSIEGILFLPPGLRSASQFMTAAEAVPASLPAKISADFRSSNAQGKLFWYHGGSIVVDDPDHIQILSPNPHAFHRAVTRQVRELPCDEKAGAQTSGEDAFYRGSAYVLMNDLTTANCWFHLGAVAGDANAQASYAYSLLRARGIQKNVEQGKAWALKSAYQHNPYGEYNLAAAYSMSGGMDGLLIPEVMAHYRLHDPDVAYSGDPTPPPPSLLPVFESDKLYTYGLRGEWRVTYPPEAPRHPVFTVVALQNNEDFQLIVGDPNIYYPIGESMFNGHYKDGHILGDLMDAPAHKGDGYRGFAWTKAEIQIVGPTTLLLPGNVKLTRTRGPMVANRACDPIQDANTDLMNAYNYAIADGALRNRGTAACWLYISASQGNTDAMIALALAFRLGTGLKQDDQQSFAWLRRAADDDDVQAERLVAHAYDLGIGTSKDPELARLWTERVNRRLEAARKEAADQQQLKAQVQRDLEKASFFFGLMTHFKSDRELKIEDYESKGFSRSQAEHEANVDEGYRQFWAGMFKELTSGYQPPPMPGRESPPNAQQQVAKATDRPSVAGLWEWRQMTSRTDYVARRYRIRQNGDDVTVSLVPFKPSDSSPEIETFRGKFVNDNTIVGRLLPSKSTGDASDKLFYDAPKYIRFQGGVLTRVGE